MHGLIMEACKSGDVEKLRPLLETGENGTQLSFGGVDGDPIAFLKGSRATRRGRKSWRSSKRCSAPATSISMSGPRTRCSLALFLRRAA